MLKIKEWVRIKDYATPEAHFLVLERLLEDSRDIIIVERIKDGINFYLADEIKLFKNSGTTFTISKFWEDMQTINIYSKVTNTIMPININLVIPIFIE